MTLRRGKKRANLRDVAQVAGVSVATVSRVLNSPNVVQVTTRARVEAAINELGFHPSAAARAINSGRSKIIGALIPTLNNDIFALTLDTIEDRLSDFGFSLVVATTDEDPAKEARKAKELLDIGVEGLLLSGVTHGADLHAFVAHTRVPAVAISYYAPDYRYPTIGYDNRAAARLALEHVLSLGHRNIAIVHGPVDPNDRTRDRIAGINDLADQARLTFFEAEMTAGGGGATVVKALSAGQHFDGYMCLTDVLAFGVIFELQRQGFRVPDDVSVMGLHDLPSSTAIFPRLSTVRLPAAQMGARAAEAIASWVETGERPAPICLTSELKVRESTAPPAQV